MVSTFYLKNPPKRKIPKGRVPRSHHYVMNYPEDLRFGKRKHLTGFPYTNFWDSFLEDCVKRMSKSEYANKLCDSGEFNIMTACLN